MSKAEISHIEDQIAAGRMNAAQVFTRMRQLIAGAEPEFTDYGRAALLWVLWHHQGGSSKVGQPIRFALGMDAHDHLGESKIAQAKLWGALEGELQQVSASVSERERFEEWYLRDHFNVKTAAASLAWSAWQAARAQTPIKE